MRTPRTVTPDNRDDWDRWLAMNRLAAIEYRRHPSLGHNAPHDPDARACLGCTHLTSHWPRWCAACRREGLDL